MIVGLVEAIALAVVGLLIGIIFRMWSARMDRQDDRIEKLVTKEALLALRQELITDLAQLNGAVTSQIEGYRQWRHEEYGPSIKAVTKELAIVVETLRHIEKRMNGK